MFFKYFFQHNFENIPQCQPGHIQSRDALKNSIIIFEYPKNDTVQFRRWKHIFQHNIGHGVVNKHAPALFVLNSSVQEHKMSRIQTILEGTVCGQWAPVVEYFSRRTSLFCLLLMFHSTHSVRRLLLYHHYVQIKQRENIKGIQLVPQLGQCSEVVPSSSAKNVTSLRLVYIEMRAEPLGLSTGERNLQDLLFFRVIEKKNL